MELNSLLDDHEDHYGHVMVCDNLENVEFFKHTNNRLNLLHVNIRSLNRNFDSLILYLESLCSDFDVIVLSETNVLNHKYDFNIAGYEVFYNESKNNKCDGSLIYCKSSVVGVSKVIQIDNHKFLRGVISHYRSPSISPNNYTLALSDLFCNNHFKGCDIELFVGDININLLDTQSLIVNEYLNCLSSHGYLSKVNKPTRTTSYSKTCIDHIFMKSKKRYDNNLIILNSSITDHHALLFNIDFGFNLENVSNTNKVDKSVRRIDYKKLNTLFMEEKWETVLVHQDSNIASECFIDTVHKHTTAATTVKPIPNKKVRLKPWITPALLVSIRNRDRLHKLHILNPNNIIARQNYKNYRDQLSRMIKITKSTYFKQKLTEINNDPRKTWELIKQATNVERSNSSISILKKGDNYEITEQGDIANELCGFFSSVGANLASKISRPRVIPNFLLSEKRFPNSMFLNPITNEEIIKSINSLKSATSSQDFSVSASIVKSNYKSLVRPLVHIVNLIFDTGVFPDIFKKTVIIPLHKGGDKTDINNYRPIALTNPICKVIEKCIKGRLCNFLYSNKLLSDSQYGFREGMGTDVALHETTDFILNCFNNNDKPLAIFLDLSKAFDTVDHHILLSKLEYVGVRGNVLKLFQSYLCNRFQKVRLNTTYSSFNKVDYGVPQGTVLGPILFSIYIDSLTTVIPNVKTVCFADDTVLLCKGRSWDEVFERAERAVTYVKTWMDLNYLTLNLNKTNFMCFAMNKKGLSNKNVIKIHSDRCDFSEGCACSGTVRSVESTKYLGVYFDQFLKWTTHTEYVKNKLKKLIYKFYELRNILSRDVIIRIYKSLTESCLNYGIICWGSAHKNALKNVVLAQKYILKIILFKSRRFCSLLLFQQSGLFTVTQLYVTSTIKFALTRNIFHRFISHNILTRANLNHNLTIPNTHFDATQRCVSFVAPKILNLLPVKLKSNNFKKNKKELNEWVKNNTQDIKNAVAFLA